MSKPNSTPEDDSQAILNEALKASVRFSAELLAFSEREEMWAALNHSPDLNGRRLTVSRLKRDMRDMQRFLDAIEQGLADG